MRFWSARRSLAFGDSQWLEAHLHLLRAAPARVLTVFDRAAPQMQAQLADAFPRSSGGGGPLLCSLTGVPFNGPSDAASFVTRRRELLSNALASSTLGVRAQMHSFEMDIQKTR